MNKDNKLELIEQDSGDQLSYRKGWMRLTYHLKNQKKVVVEQRDDKGKKKLVNRVYHTRSMRYVHHDEIDRLVMHLQQLHGNNWGSKAASSPDYHVSWEKHLGRV